MAQNKKSMSLEDFARGQNPQPPGGRLTGRIVKTVPASKYGFIKANKTDHHFQYKDIIGGHNPEEGQDVEFDRKEGERGPRAVNIKIINPARTRETAPAQNIPEPAGSDFRLPLDTRSAISRSKVDNFALKLNKYALLEKDKNGKPVFRLSEAGFDFRGVNFTDMCKDIKEAAISLCPEFNHTENLKTDWRMAIGLGTESVYETSMTLHPIWGFPYIPGQAVKGITRSWIILNYFGGSEGRAMSESETFCRIFGCQAEITEEINGEKRKYTSTLKEDYQGAVIFYDALPVDAPNLKTDVMNPHFSDYYSLKRQPGDDHNPIPIYFLTVENTSFQFVLGIRKEQNIKGKIFNDNKEEPLFNIAKREMKDALTQHGIGAKTSVGYGYFK